MKQNASEDRKRSLGVKEPLLNKAEKKVRTHLLKGGGSKSSKAPLVVQLTCTFFGPLFIFAFMLFFTSYEFYYSANITWIALFVVCALCYLWYETIDHCFKKYKWQKSLGILCGISACVGFGVGVFIHYRFFLFYYKYKHMMYYTNVAASQPVQEFQDAGTLLFTDGTKVDTARAVGYHNIRTAETLCVAPVIDNQMSSNDPVVFWAVGTGCCSWRASFNCDDAKQTGNRGGLLILEPNNLVSASMEWVVKYNFDYEGFDDAVDMAKSVFAISTSKHKRFVRWVKDPKDEYDKFRKRGLECCIIALLIYICFALARVVNDVLVQQKEQQMLADKLTGMDEA